MFPDVHRPFHSQKCWDLIFRVGIDLKPMLDKIILLGDYLDFINLSGHGPKDPRIFQSLQDEIISGNLGMDQLDQVFPDTLKVMMEGNHTHRVERFVMNNAPQLFGITEAKRLLELDRRKNWLWVDYGPNQQYHVGAGLHVRHEPLKTFPHLTVKEAGTSLIYGHVHRIEAAWRTNLQGERHFAGCPGWIGNKKSRAFNYIKGIQNWQEGFAVVFYDKKNFWPYLIPIADNSCWFNGRLYRV